MLQRIFGLRSSEKKTLQWLANLNSTLKLMACTDLKAYCLDADQTKREPPENWPYLAISPDQGPDAVCSSYYLGYHCNANIQFVWGPSHGHQRDFLLSCGSLGMTSFLHLMTIVYNLGHGPWDSHERYGQLVSCFEDYLQHHVSKCPLFQHLKKPIATGFGVAEFGGDLPSDDVIIQAMRKHWSMRKKGTKVHLCRFGDFPRRSREFAEVHHFTLLRCLVLGLGDNLFTKKKRH